MSDHDPLCSWPDQYILRVTCPECTMIFKVRADERERIAQAIEAAAADVRAAPHEPSTRGWRAAYFVGCDDAARIARGEG